jgi:hypothetical protein
MLIADNPLIFRRNRAPGGAAPLWTVIHTSGILGWASLHIEKLRAGETVSFRPKGQSMAGRIESGQLCTVAPVDPSTLEVGDIVLCRVGGHEYLHIVRAIQGGRCQIGNNRGRINGWVGSNGIFGKCIRIET